MRVQGSSEKEVELKARLELSKWSLLSHLVPYSARKGSCIELVKALRIGSRYEYSAVSLELLSLQKNKPKHPSAILSTVISSCNGQSSGDCFDASPFSIDAVFRCHSDFFCFGDGIADTP
uniref:Uncharacterized protein n=1 Tax=Sphaerodactylus townsendi TaxID=933632 RepID=A0ACB8G3W3_9SAUR